MSKELPYVHPKLVSHLREIFPLSRYNSIKTIEDLHEYQGIQSVIKYLEGISNKQQKENILNVPLQET